ncbi:MAG: GAF domain-containing sensor histidine kinase [Bacteroidota bacterium]
MNTSVEHHQDASQVKISPSNNFISCAPEPEYHTITTLAATICDVPIALLTLLKDGKPWIKSHYGVPVVEKPGPASFFETNPRSTDRILSVDDARNDPRFADNELVHGDAKIVFYVGISLVNRDGFTLGTLSILDYKPRELNHTQMVAMRALAQQVIRLQAIRDEQVIQKYELQQLEEKNQALEQFAYVAAHDLRAPLNSITGLASLIQNTSGTKMDREGQQYLGMINDLSGKLKNLVDELLEYSRCGKILEEERSEIFLDVLMEDLRQMHITADHISLDLQANVDRLFLNRTALMQILMNLVSNAIKYNDKPDIRIVVGIMNYEEEYQCFVEDNGPGIPEKMHEKIFEPFAVAAHRDQQGREGTGIGLATVTKLVTALGGAIHLKSTLGEGSVFHFSLKK